MTTPEQTEKPKLEASAIGLWWIYEFDTWRVCRLSPFRAAMTECTALDLVVFYGPTVPPSRRTIFFQDEIDEKTWGGRILNPDQQEAK